MTEKEFNDVFQIFFEHNVTVYKLLLKCDNKSHVIYQSDFGPICVSQEILSLVKRD